MLRLLHGRCIELAVLMLSMTLISLVSSAERVQAASTVPLQLEVILNEAPTNLVGSFVQYPDKRIGARAAELAELGIHVSASLSRSDLPIRLDDIPGLTYRYDEPAQKIFLRARDELLITKVYDVRRAADRSTPPAPPDFGSVVNYTLFAASSASFSKSMFDFSGANASIDARIFGPYGTLSQTAILGTTFASQTEALRLDTTWTYSDPTSLKTYRAGDVISGGLAWTRPIRLGGAQVQRNFSLRPDLVTMPLPSMTGSAAVPSTLDVFVNNLKVHTQDLPPGPYQLTNIPVLTGAGDARVVVRDSSGRPSEISLPFFASPKLLAPGLMDFSVEAGVPRVGFGTYSSSYLLDAVGSATLRTGFQDWFTAEGHVESGMGLVNGGAGGAFGIGALGVVSMAVAASRFERESGAQTYLALDAQIGRINLHLSSQRTFGAYEDLAALTARYGPILSPVTPSLYPYIQAPAALRPPRYLDTISVGTPFLDSATLSVALVHLDLNVTKPSDLATISYSRPAFAGGSIYVTAFRDLDDKKSFGIFGGITIPIGDRATVSAGVNSTHQGTSYTAEAVKSLGSEPGSYGWRVRGSQGDPTYYAAGGSYRSSIGRVDGDVMQIGGATSGAVQAEGAIAVMGGGVFLANRIDDAFAVVDVGAPDVDVLYENRPAGKTNAQGQVLVPNLRSYQTNHITIDPQGLPLNAEASVVQEVVTPADRSGVVVHFGVKADGDGAVLILQRRDGSFVPPGTEIRLEGAQEPFVVGYDGKTFLTGLGSTNTVVVDDPAGTCRASFPFTPKPETQVVIGPLTCQ